MIAGISVGDSFTRVRERLGAPQFGFSPDDVTGAPGKGAGFYATYAGYRTREFSVAFEGEAGGEVRSICICRRYPLPEARRDMLPVLAAHAPWYEVGGNDADADADWKRCFGEDAPVWYEQLGRGSMTLFCGYGFISTSTGEEDDYQVYADYEGDIPDIPEVEVLKADWPGQQIWGIYDDLARVRAAVANRQDCLSPDGNVLAFAVSDGLYEQAYVQFHWMDASRPTGGSASGIFPASRAFSATATCSKRTCSARTSTTWRRTRSSFRSRWRTGWASAATYGSTRPTAASSTGKATSGTFTILRPTAR